MTHSAMLRPCNKNINKIFGPEKNARIGGLDEESVRQSDRGIGGHIVAVTTKRQISRFSVSKDDFFPLFWMVISQNGKIIWIFF